ncbi:Eco57I restriction-modification methylase domain-containing protein [Pseudonocardia adelaidensis]|uniref:site-specific DNA-methyltransferase (adenine-specific) n=1 Tax=Pseudonocardia adelaidensis TaxID=648754 RepID=A0ABP9P264_9PSEU
MEDSTGIPEDVVEHGEVFTRRWVVEFILDLCGYTADRDLVALRAVEPACGTGAFLGPMIERLSQSAKAYGYSLNDAGDAIRAFDLLPKNVEATRKMATAVLTAAGWDEAESEMVVSKWIATGDYLLRPAELGSVDFVIGNPPYIRLEDVPETRTLLYRAACQSMTGRADIYVGFIELGLRSLREGGRLGFIVADRWMRNQYGKQLRKMIGDGYSVDVTIQMHDVNAFEESVSAYPAVSVIRRAEQRAAVVANTTSRFGPDDAVAITEWVRGDRREPVLNDRYEISELPRWFRGEDLWPSGSPAVLALVEDLNERFYSLEDRTVGTRIGIGVATGADGVFVTRDSELVEPERLLPLSMAQDTTSGTLKPSGHYLVNPWDEGSLVDLADWPRLRRYFESQDGLLKRRNVAHRQPSRWYRTIDKVDHKLTAREKLLFPDMKMTSHPVYDPGGTYPHHNLYFIVSDTWDLKVLGGLLLSKVAEMTVGAYCVKMRGGTLRFQAQYLRRIRVPRPEDVSAKDADALAAAFEKRDTAAATEVAIRVYGLSEETASWLKSTNQVRSD